MRLEGCDGGGDVGIVDVAMAMAKGMAKSIRTQSWAL